MLDRNWERRYQIRYVGRSIMHLTISPVRCIQPTKRRHKVHSPIVFDSGSKGFSVLGRSNDLQVVSQPLTVDERGAHEWGYESYWRLKKWFIAGIIIRWSYGCPLISMTVCDTLWWRAFLMCCTCINKPAYATLPSNAYVTGPPVRVNNGEMGVIVLREDHRRNTG